MAKIRAPFSICDAVRQAHALLGSEGVTAVTGKSAALVGKWSDPDADGHHIQFRHAIALDVAMICAGHQPPHLEVLKTALVDAMPATMPSPPKTLAQRVSEIGKEFGDVAGLVVKAEADGTVTRTEKARLHKELDDLIRAARQAQRALR